MFGRERQRYAALINNANSEEAFIFHIDSIDEKPNLDRNFSRRDCDDLKMLWQACGYDDSKFQRVQSMAAGKVVLPFQKGGLRSREFAESDIFISSVRKRTFESSNDEAGPLVFAMKGNYVVAGFQNGTI